MFNSNHVFLVCDRESVRAMQDTLLNVTLVARNGRPDSQSETDWVNIRGKHLSFSFLNKEIMCEFPPFVFVTIIAFKF